MTGLIRGDMCLADCHGWKIADFHSMTGQVPDRCVRVTHCGRRPVWDGLMFFDGQLWYAEGFAARAHEFRTLIPAHIDFKWKRGSWVQFPIRPVTLSAQSKVLGRSVSFYTLS